MYSQFTLKWYKLRVCHRERKRGDPVAAAGFAVHCESDMPQGMSGAVRLSSAPRNDTASLMRTSNFFLILFGALIIQTNLVLADSSPVVPQAGAQTDAGPEPSVDSLPDEPDPNATEPKAPLHKKNSEDSLGQIMVEFLRHLFESEPATVDEQLLRDNP